MCHTIHYTDRDKTELCEDGRLGRKCMLTEEWVAHSRKHALAKLDLSKIESSASLAERLPTPYAHLPLSTSPNRDGPGVYVNGTKVVELSKPKKHRDHRDDYDYRYERRSSRYHDADPRDRDDDRRGRDPASTTLKRSSTMPYVVIQQEKPRRRSSSRDDYGGDLVREYTRRRRSRSRSRSRDRNAARHGLYYRKHTADGYVVVDDGEKERRRRRRGSIDYTTTSAAPEPRSIAEVRYTPRRASTIIHRSDGTTLETKRSSPKPKQVAWDDEVRVKRESPLDARQAQNIKIASRPKQRSDPDRDPRLKGILKNTDSNKAAKTYREESEERRREEIRRAVEKMGIQTSHHRDRDEGRGRSREPQEWDEQVERLRTRLGDVKFHDGDDREDRRKRTKVWMDDRFVYR